MVSKKGASASNTEGGFRVEGVVQKEQSDCDSAELKLFAYAFDKSGAELGKAAVEESGKYSVSLALRKPIDVKLVIGPEGEAQQIRRSSGFSHSFSANDWHVKGTEYSLQYDAILPLDVLKLWWPNRMCVSGHVRKVVTENEETDYCAVPYVKVEVFDVDRESCFWPWIIKWPELVLDHPVVRIPEIIKEPVFPPIKFPPGPQPDPVPDLKFSRLANTRLSASINASFNEVAFNPQPEPPAMQRRLLQNNVQRVGEMAQLEPSVASRLDQLTLTSKIAPWYIFPWCFYSKQLVCETTTDCNGYFNCCFDWWPFHFRSGRLRYDSRPDIIIRVTQIINGVETVIYMDPYTSTRWNVNYAHIDLFLDNEEVVCSHSECYQPEDGSPVFFTRIGDDEVYQINQTTGLYNQGSLVNVAYGSTMNVYGQFGDDLTQADPASGGSADYYYYRLSYAPQGSADDEFKFIDVNLSDTRVEKLSLNAASHKLGPFTVNSIPSLYEVRNFEDYYWYNPDYIGIWHSILAEEDTGTYTLRLEMFDKNGSYINSAANTVDYRNGAGIGDGTPPTPLPAMIDHCDLLMTLDNKAPIAEITIPSAINDCGVIPFASVPPFDVNVAVSQENNRLRQWQLWYTKGVGSEQFLTQYVSDNGLPGSDNETVSVDGLLTGLTTTCAFAFRLRAWAHIRNGRHFIYIDQDIDAVAIEKCPECEECS